MISGRRACLRTIVRRAGWIVVRKRLRRHAAGGRPLDTPPQQSIRPRIDERREAAKHRRAEQVPRHVKGRGREQRRITADQRRQGRGGTPGDHRLTQCRRLPGRQPPPARQLTARVSQPQVERAGEVGHRPPGSGAQPLLREALAQEHGRQRRVHRLRRDVDPGHRPVGVDVALDLGAPEPRPVLGLVDVMGVAQAPNRIQSRIFSPKMARSRKCVTFDVGPCPAASSSRRRGPSTPRDTRP